ncbi:MAG: hypothetical protein HUK19_03715 [Fibrobacter sp.]|nr:hypothetical protein [Fibrobacter sp.]
MYTACSNDTISAPVDGDSQATLSSSSVDPDDDGEASSSATAVGKSSASGTKDSVVHQTVIITSAGSRVVPYSSSGTFCWTEKCEKDAASAAPKSSSSISIQVTMSSEAQTPPTVTETKMIDQRDQKEYKLARIAGLHWMTENLNYETKTGYYCSYGENTGLCGKYGGFYAYATAQRICPEGWRLPTKAEVLAVDEVVDQDWWTIGGRFKYDNDGPTAYGLEKEQGYIWIESEDGFSSWRVEDYDEKKDHDFQGSDAAAGRAYNVRCVSEQ